MNTATRTAVSISHLSHHYGDRKALDDLSLQIKPGELFGMLGPNGSGKTTLFRILSTLIEPSSSQVDVQIFGNDLIAQREVIRRELGVVFQSPSLDKQLTAAENLRHHGQLYGLRGAVLAVRIREALAAANLSDRSSERVGAFSGGMRRRVELAKGLLTRPKLLLLDEPSTGLDPAARIDLWNTLLRVRSEMGVTIVLTTHLMDEADRCDRIAILSRGKLLALDSPAALKSQFAGGDVVSLRTRSTKEISAQLRDRFSIDSTCVDGTVRFEQSNAAELIPRLFEVLPNGSIESLTLGQPTLEDVFIRVAGEQFIATRSEEATK